MSYETDDDEITFEDATSEDIFKIPESYNANDFSTSVSGTEFDGDVDDSFEVEEYEEGASGFSMTERFNDGTSAAYDGTESGLDSEIAVVNGISYGYQKSGEIINESKIQKTVAGNRNHIATVTGEKSYGYQRAMQIIEENQLIETNEISEYTKHQLIVIQQNINDVKAGKHDKKK